MIRTIAGAASALTLLVVASQAHAAITITPRHQYDSVTPTKDGSAYVACQSGETLVGGGFDANSSDVFVLNSMPSGNGWWVYARNVGSGTKSVYAFAVCASGDSNVTSWGISSSPVSVSPGYNGTAEPECSGRGRAAAGGFYSYSSSTDFTAVQSFPTYVTGEKTWKTVFHNAAWPAKSFTGVALCVENLDATFSTHNRSEATEIEGGTNGFSYRFCPGTGVISGSGWIFDTLPNRWVYGARSAGSYGFARGHHDGESWEAPAFLTSYVRCITPT